ncbi:malto-oligosyltrehalose trehalohydrolase [Serinicoccus chungangensis]|uniref:Malto-oligosyltrehalose trehalohydrolase n=1 Tax=Serinicoccus chungangensis TaxID=767452 RepID=A0A0W8IEH6_9MICO|nr:malto-oligosyltrehalose trehalohydrolase [Serinicoccus chungangensis]KUG58331.1 malto-oligosyltrehalose trehalohydrolase [Serinicoccus chungangensis]
MSAQQVRLWAPDAEQVELVLGATGGERVAMAPSGSSGGGAGTASGDGWWSVTADVAAHGGRYAFAVDGGDPVPDPRSRHQPDGVHAASALVDTGAFPWTDQGWRGVPLERAAVYELHVGTFTEAGTFDAAAERLGHLVELGVSVVELMPVAAFPGRHGWGYDGVALYAVHDAYGGPQGLARFVDAAHAAGLAVWLDVVYNHLGPSGNYLRQTGPYFTDRHHTPWGEAVNLDGPGSDEVRAYLLDNARMWLEDYHLDGLRLDAVHALHDERAVHVLEELAALADDITGRTGVPRSLVAESDRNDPATVARRGPGGAGGLGLHGQWADDVHHALHVLLSGESQGYYGDFADPGAVPKVLGRTPFFHDGTLSTFRGRVHGRPVHLEVTEPWRFVASLQTHDQVGNRAVGDRLHHGIPAGRHAVGAALLLTAPWTPMLFMGEEWGASTPWQYFTDHEEEWLAQSIREGRQAEFAEHGWAGEVPDPQDTGTVTASTLRWAEVDEGEHAEMLAFYRALLHWRRDTPAQMRGTVGEVTRKPDGTGGEVLTVTRPGVALVARLGGEGEVAVPPPGGDHAARPAGVDLVAAFPATAGEPAAGQLRLGPDSVVVVRR